MTIVIILYTRLDLAQLGLGAKDLSEQANCELPAVDNQFLTWTHLPGFVCIWSKQYM